MEIEYMTDKQYEGMLKDNIACLNRGAEHTTAEFSRSEKDL